MAMKKLKLNAMAILVTAVLWVFPTPARAGEAYIYQGESEFSASFYLIGGQYALYLNAKRPIRSFNAPEARGCIFGGNLERVWPSEETMSLGAGITISTIVPHKIGPTSLTMPAGLYRLHIAPLTTCDWKFVINSTNQNTASVAPVRMLRFDKAGRPTFSETAAVKDKVQFNAQYRTDHDAQAPASGVVQIINGGKIVLTLPLQAGPDFDGAATAFYVDVQWDQNSLKYLGKNSAKFVVKIGASEFTGTGEFTLTQ